MYFVRFLFVFIRGLLFYDPTKIDHEDTRKQPVVLQCESSVLMTLGDGIRDTLFELFQF